MTNPWNTDIPFSPDGMWLGTTYCRERINRKITGEDQHWLRYVHARYITPHVQSSSNPASVRCLILGSNEGVLELDLWQNGFPGEIIASDIADKALARAADKVRAAGFENVRHILADLNVDSFDGSFDFIICEGVLHHIGELRRCLERLRGQLKPGRLMFAVEFEGPFRFQLPEPQVRWINAALRVIPREQRPLPRNADHGVPATDEDNRSVYYAPPSAEAIAALDPTEAYSGPELKLLLPKLFEVVERKGFGGTLLSYMTGHFDFARAESDPFAAEWLKVLCQIEDTTIVSGLLQDEFVFYVLRRP